MKIKKEIRNVQKNARIAQGTNKSSLSQWWYEEIIKLTNTLTNDEENIIILAKVRQIEKLFNFNL